MLRTNLRDSFRIFTKLFRVFVGSLACGGGYGNCNNITNSDYIFTGMYITRKQIFKLLIIKNKPKRCHVIILYCSDCSYRSWSAAQEVQIRVLPEEIGFRLRCVESLAAHYKMTAEVGTCYNARQNNKQHCRQHQRYLITLHTGTLYINPLQRSQK